MISFGNAASSHIGLIPLKTAYKKGGELTCIQLLLLQFLHVIWSMPTNFVLFKKPLDNFFYTLDNPEINRQ